LERIPPASAIYVRSKVEATRILAGYDASTRTPAVAELADLEAASSVCESLVLDEVNRHTLHQEVLVGALNWLRSPKQVLKSVPPGKRILGNALGERNIRFDLERSLRAMARMRNGEERIRLVEKANQLRPLTLF
jgi:serine/threonine-protein kinase PknG